MFLLAQSPADIGAGAVSRGREEAGLYGGDKEFRMYQPAGDTGKDQVAVAAGVFYKKLAKDCAARQVRCEELVCNRCIFNFGVLVFLVYLLAHFMLPVVLSTSQSII